MAALERVAARLKILFRRKRALKIFDALNTWQKGGKALVIFKKFYHRMRMIQ